MTASLDSALEEPESIPEVDAPAHFRFRIPHFAFLTTLLCCLALLAALASPFFAGRVYVADDLGGMHLPMRVFYSQQLAAGEPFDWNPDLFAGFYLTGEGQAGTYHPLHWLLYRCLPLPVAFDLECLLSYPFMLAGMYVFLRRWRMRRGAARFGAMTFTFGGFNLLHFVHPNVVAIVAHLPWLLAAIDVMVRGIKPRHRRLAFVAVALLTGSQLLLGSPQFVLFSLMLEAGYVLWWGGAGGAVRWAAAILIGCLIGGVQLLPSIDVLAHSVRHSAGIDLAAYGSLDPLNLIQLAAPYLFDTRVVGQNTHELGLYFGAMPLVLAVWWLFDGRRGNWRRLATFAVATAVLAIVWAFGAMGPLGWLETHLPLVNRFRFPSRAIVLFQFAVAALAALGLTALARQAKFPPRGISTAWLWILPAFSAAAAIIARIRWPEHVSAWPLMLVGPVLVTAAVWLVIRAAHGSRWAIAAMVVFTAADLGAYGLSYSVIGQNESLTKYVRETSAPPGDINGRVALDLMSGTETANGEHGPRIGDRILLAGWKCIDGYTGLEPARRLDYRMPAALRAAGVTWVSQAAAEKMDSDKSGLTMREDWHAVADPQPRAWLVTRAVVSSHPKTDIARISLPDEVLVEQSLPSPLPAGSPGTTKIVVDRPGRIDLNVACRTTQLAVINESFHDGWRATLDGKTVEALRINGDFLGLIVPAGDHEISLEFRPKSLIFGRVMSGFGLGLIVTIVFWPRRRIVAD